MAKRRILIQLDTDPQPSVFDRVVAIDAGTEELFSYGAVVPDQVQEIIHGAIFTRGPDDLKSTAVFIGGRDVAAGERLLAEAKRHLLPQFGLQVSLMLDPNGANTTAAAAVRSAATQVPLAQAAALVLGATGPVGQRVVLLLARQGAEVRVASRSLQRAEAVCQRIRERFADARLTPVATATSEDLDQALHGRNLVISAGALGVEMLPQAKWQPMSGLKVLVDLNAVPPAGIGGIDVADRGEPRGNAICYGAIGVGQRKMKIHKAAIRRLFERNDLVLDVEEIHALAESVE